MSSRLTRQEEHEEEETEEEEAPFVPHYLPGMANVLPNIARQPSVLYIGSVETRSSVPDIDTFVRKVCIHMSS
jgi:hypothetical protein